MDLFTANLRGIYYSIPHSYNYGFNIGIKINSIKTSLIYSNRVTGAKSSLSDFSGLIRLKNELKGSTFGIIYEPFEYNFNKFKLILGFKGLVTNSDFSTEVTSIISENSTNENLDFSSIDIGIGSIASINYDLKYLILRAHLDFDLYLSAKLKFKDNNDLHLLNQSGDNVRTDWTGLNLNLGIIIPIIKS